MEFWTSSVDDKIPCDAILLDISKAFDTVLHSILLNKLASVGVGGLLLDWIAAFLQGRLQRVTVDGICSIWAPVSSGVPQGTVLGPLLFLVYVNDFPGVVSSFCNLFADDAKLSRKLHSHEDITALQQDLDNIFAWANVNKLAFNSNKCEVIHFGKNNICHNYSIGGAPLQNQETVKSLGITITRDLKPSTQCSIAARKANAALGQIKRNFSYLTPRTLRLLYTTYVRPHLEYCVQAWAPYMSKDCLVLEAVQRRATRLIPALRHLAYPERAKRIGLPLLDDRRSRGDLLQTYKIVKGVDKIPPRSFFIFNETSRTRGHPYKLVKPAARTLLRASSFTHRVINPWNALPTDIVCAESTTNFKCRFDRLQVNDL
jgi:hypothetical protein